MGLRPTNTNEGASDRCRGIDNLDRAFNKAFSAQPGRDRQGAFSAVNAPVSNER